MDANVVSTDLASTFVSRLHKLASLWGLLEQNYSRLTLSALRYLYGNSNTPIAEVRGMAEAKFFLAAVLQWSPSAYGFRVAKLANGQSPADVKIEGRGEYCPVWADFFDDLVEADQLVSGSAELVSVQHVDDLLLKAEAKYLWVQWLFDIVHAKGEFVQGPDDIPLKEAMIYTGWNRFCSKVVKSGSVVDAVLGLRQIDKQPATGGFAANVQRNIYDHGHRLLFKFTLPTGCEPWAQYAISLLSEPSIDRYTATMAEQYAFWQAYPHLRWKLFFDQDPSLPKYHPQCSTTSTCRRAADFCPCKARCEECPNGNCSRSSPWVWPCEARDIEEVSISPACAKATTPANPIPPAPTTIMNAYNAGWAAVSHIDPNIPFPDPSLTLAGITNRHGHGLPYIGNVLGISDDRFVELKAKCFFLSGFHVAFDIGPSHTSGIVVEPRFPQYDVLRVQQLLQQLKIERERWMAELLNRRTGDAGYAEPALGNDFVVVAIRKAVWELIAECEKLLRRWEKE